MSTWINPATYRVGIPPASFFAVPSQAFTCSDLYLGSIATPPREDSPSLILDRMAALRGAYSRGQLALRVATAVRFQREANRG